MPYKNQVLLFGQFHYKLFYLTIKSRNWDEKIQPPVSFSVFPAGGR